MLSDIAIQFSHLSKQKTSNTINFHCLPFFTTLLFLFVIRNVFQSIDFLVVVAIFPFFKVLSIFCVERSALVSLILHFSFRFSRSVFVFTAIFEPFELTVLISGRTLVLDSDSNRFRPIFQGSMFFFSSNRNSTSFTQHVIRPTNRLYSQHKTKHFSSCIFMLLERLPLLLRHDFCTVSQVYVSRR